MLGDVKASLIDSLVSFIQGLIINSSETLNMQKILCQYASS